MTEQLKKNQMITHHNNGQEYLIANIPEGAKWFAIEDGNVLQHLYGSWYEKLPPGQWEIMGIGSELTEQQAGEVVEKLQVKPKFVGDKSQSFYYDYGHKFYIMKFATQSLHSLIQSHNLTPETALFIKKINP